MNAPMLKALPPAVSGRDGWPWSAASSVPPGAVAYDEGWPTISVVTPSYNQGQFIEETLRSVLLQGYPKLEYFVMDGGSDDGSVAVIERYADWLAGWSSQPDRGQAHAINKGFALADGEILAWLNSDDIYCANAFFEVARCFREFPGAMVVSGACRLVDEERRPLAVKGSHSLDLHYLLRGGGVPGQPSVFFRRQVFEEIGGLKESLNYELDWEYWVRIADKYPPSAVAKTDAILSEARIWDAAKTSVAGLAGVEERQRAYDGLYNDARSSPRLKRMRAVTRSSVYWRRALWYWRNQRKYDAMPNLMRAVVLNPNPATNLRRLQMLLLRGR